MTETDEVFDSLLAEVLAPPDRPADPVFVARVDHAILASEQYRRRRNALWRQFGGETVAIGAVGASLAVISRIPGVRDVLSQATNLTLLTLLALPLLLIWILMTRARPGWA